MVNDPARARLLELAEERGYALSHLSKLIGRNTTYLQQFVRKGSPRKLEENDRRVLARFLDVDEAELGREPIDEISQSPAASAERVRSRAPVKRPRQPWIAIPRLALGASAGPGALAEDDGTVGHLGFAESWLREMGLTPGRLTALTVMGDSMVPALSDGDEILVERIDGQIGHRPRAGIYVIRREGMLLVKRLDYLREGRVTVISDNRAYPPEDAAIDEVEVIARVVWKGGRV